MSGTNLRFLTKKIGNTTIIFDVRVCVTMHHIWKWWEVPTWCNNCDLLSHISTCFGHLYAHLQEYRLYATVYGVQHCKRELALVVGFVLCCSSCCVIVGLGYAICCIGFSFSLQRLYSPGWASASFKSFLHPSWFRATIFQFLHPVLGSGATKYVLRSLGWLEMLRWSGGMQSLVAVMVVCV